MERKTTSRRDDIQLILNLIYYLLTARFYGADSKMEYCQEGIEEKFMERRSKFDESIFVGNAAGLKDFASYAYSLGYEDAPDYNQIRFLFTKNLLEMNIIPTKEYDWN